MSGLDAAAARYHAELHRIGPWAGPCPCGDTDSRHRAAADIATRYTNGEDPAAIAATYPGMTALDVLEVAAAWHDVQAAAAARGVPTPSCAPRGVTR
jgi:hypothetical protein